jgi:Cu/Ag efflux protein CusF
VLLFSAFVVATLFLALTSLGSAEAAPAAGHGYGYQGKHGLFGVVTAVTPLTGIPPTGTVAITIKRTGNTETLKIDANTKVHVPGNPEALVADIDVGDQVAVLVERRPDGFVYIVKINVLPSQAQANQIALTIVGVSADGKTVSAVTSTGEPIVVQLDSPLSGVLRGQLLQGQVVIFIGEQPEPNRFNAHAAMRLEKIIARLDKHVKDKKVEAERERDAQAKGRKQHDVERLKARLEANLQEHLDRFAEVIARAPEQQRPGLERALENFKKESSAALGSINSSPQQVHDIVERRTLKGTVESIDSTTKEITIRSRGDASIKVKALPTTAIKTGEATGAFADIQVGDSVDVRFNQQNGEATSVHVKLEVDAKGKIKTINATAKTLVLELPANATLTLRLVDGTKIEVNGRPATVANLSEGAVVEVKYNSRTLELRSVEGKLKDQLKLTVDRVDAQAGTIVSHTDNGKSITVKVTDGTRVQARGALSSIFGLQTGARIEVEINPLTGEALKIKRIDQEDRREEATARGTVVKVDDAATKKLTVRQPNQSEVTVTITNATELEADKKGATLADFKDGDVVKVKYDPRTTVALEVEKKGKDKDGQRPEPKGVERGKVQGTITAVDPAKGTVTIFTKDGETRVVNIRPATAMSLNDRRISTLSQLPVAAAVKVEHTGENVAVKVEAKKSEADIGRKDSEGDKGQRR